MKNIIFSVDKGITPLNLITDCDTFGSTSAIICQMFSEFGSSALQNVFNSSNTGGFSCTNGLLQVSPQRLRQIQISDLAPPSQIQNLEMRIFLVFFGSASCGTLLMFFELRNCRVDVVWNVLAESRIHGFIGGKRSSYL